MTTNNVRKVGLVQCGADGYLTFVLCGFSARFALASLRNININPFGFARWLVKDGVLTLHPRLLILKNYVELLLRQL